MRIPALVSGAFRRNSKSPLRASALLILAPFLLAVSPLKAMPQQCTLAMDASQGAATAVSCESKTGEAYNECMNLNLTACGQVWSGYTLSVGTPLPASVNLNGSANAKVLVLPANGYVGTVNVSCTPVFSPANGNGTPATQCTPATSSVTFKPEGFRSPQSVSLTVNPADFRGTLTLTISAVDQGNLTPVSGSLTLGPMIATTNGGSVIGGGGLASVATFCGLLMVWVLCASGGKSALCDPAPSEPSIAIMKESAPRGYVQLLLRVGLSLGLAFAAHLFGWRWLRFADSEFVRWSWMLLGQTPVRWSFDTIEVRGTFFQFATSCTFIDVVLGAVPFLWKLELAPLRNAIFVVSVSIIFLGLNCLRLIVSQVVYACGAPWFVADGVFGGVSYFAAWLFLYSRYESDPEKSNGLRFAIGRRLVRQARTGFT